MAENDVLLTLQEFGFLEGISDQHLQQLAGIARPASFPAGKLVFRDGDPASNIYLLTSGSVSVEICAPGIGCRRILTVGSGDLLGVSPILEQSRLTATARALEDTEAIELNAGQVLALCEHSPQFGYEFMRRAALALGKRLSATRLQLLDVFGAENPSPKPGQ